MNQFIGKKNCFLASCGVGKNYQKHCLSCVQLLYLLYLFLQLIYRPMFVDSPLWIYVMDSEDVTFQSQIIYLFGKGYIRSWFFEHILKMLVSEQDTLVVSIRPIGTLDEKKCCFLKPRNTYNLKKKINNYCTLKTPT